jgi:hypothetical protein
MENLKYQDLSKYNINNVYILYNIYNILYIFFKINNKNKKA